MVTVKADTSVLEQFCLQMWHTIMIKILPYVEIDVIDPQSYTFSAFALIGSFLGQLQSTLFNHHPN